MTTETTYIQEVLLWIPDNKFDYFIELTKIENTTLAEIEIADVLGLPTKANGANQEPILDGDEANVEAIIVGVTDGVSNALTLAAAAVSDDYYFVLKQGPALVNATKIHSVDVAGDPIDSAALLTALAALNIKTRSESAYTSTQAN